jgi:hypothetical protein
VSAGSRRQAQTHNWEARRYQLGPAHAQAPTGPAFKQNS